MDLHNITGVILIFIVYSLGLIIVFSEYTYFAIRILSFILFYFIFLFIISLCSIYNESLLTSIKGDYEEIYSLKSNTGISGSFILGTGSIDSNPQYYYYVDLGNNEKTMKSIDAHNTIIKETNAEHPKIIRFYRVYHPIIYYLAYPVTGQTISSVKHPIIIVPENTVLKEFTL